MKFLLISGSSSRKIVTQYLIQAAKKYFDTVLSVPLAKIRIECTGGKNRLFYKNTDLATFDVCYARLFAKDFVFGDVVLDILEHSDVYIPTSADSFQIVNHKYYTVKALSRVGIPVPMTFLSVSSEPAVKITKRMGFPVVVKLLSGFGGMGVMLAKDESDFRPIVDTLKVFREFISVQEFVKARNEDLRCYVFGDDIKVVKRVAPKGDWRANVSRGGTARWSKLPEGAREIVLNSARVLGMDLCAIDLLQKDGSVFVVEANFAPGIMPKIFRRRLAQYFVEFLYKRGKKAKLLGARR